MNRFHLNRNSTEEEISLFPLIHREHTKAKKWRPQEGEYYFTYSKYRGIEYKLFTEKVKWCLDDLEAGNFFLTNTLLIVRKQKILIILITILIAIEVLPVFILDKIFFFIPPIINNIGWIIVIFISLLCFLIFCMNTFDKKRNKITEFYTVYYNFEYGTLNAYLILGERRLNLFSSPNCYLYNKNNSHAIIVKESKKWLNYYLKQAHLEIISSKHIVLVEEEPKFYGKADFRI